MFHTYNLYTAVQYCRITDTDLSKSDLSFSAIEKSKLGDAMYRLTDEPTRLVQELAGKYK